MQAHRHLAAIVGLVLVFVTHSTAFALTENSVKGTVEGGSNQTRPGKVLEGPFLGCKTPDDLKEVDGQATVLEKAVALAWKRADRRCLTVRGNAIVKEYIELVVVKYERRGCIAKMLTRINPPWYDTFEFYILLGITNPKMLVDCQRRGE